MTYNLQLSENEIKQQIKTSSSHVTFQSLFSLVIMTFTTVFGIKSTTDSS